MADAGADLIHVEAGQTVHDDWPEYRRGFLTALSDRASATRHGCRSPSAPPMTIDDANTAVAAGELTSSSLEPARERHRAFTGVRVNKLLQAEVSG